ncbi:MAG TPA: hypothetical protein VH392_00795, partial [Sphingomicrobium sp.]
MLLPVAAAFGARAAVVAVFPGPVELRSFAKLALAALAILARTREARSLVCATAVITLLPRLVVASIARPELTIAVAIPELAILKAAGGASLVAVPTRSIIAVATRRPIVARLVRTLVAITLPRSVRLPVAELPIGKTRGRAPPVAIAARRVRALVAIAVTARLERALLTIAITRGTIAERPVAAGTVVAAEPGSVAATFAIEFLIEFLIGFPGAKASLGELLLRPPRLARTAPAALGTLAPA